ncbi:NAD(P)-dependent oxidoreductase [Cryptosporangium aurantiacum]|uniref:Putative NADH-flavin reductase n=1 Tax=Cryptosporangium aurantiacum TaxID=134849 RepID=A0A1M7QFK8_9ACTN|nr:SDR family oxidoreductase [Cryptosporangium aurantiacum]SHN29705.1 Putative NADH-flavin reductase [Cryptosporangium aurantiacum]
MKILVFGANGPTGRRVTQQALDEGHEVTAFTRRAFPRRHERLRVHTGDVHDPGSVDDAVAGQDAVISALGVPYTRKPVSVYSRGGAHIVAAMERHGVRRLVCVTSTVTGSDHVQTGGFVFNRILQPFLVNVVGRTVYADMAALEAAVRASDLDWTIVRPSGLYDADEVTAYRVGKDHVEGRFTSRADLADCLLRQVTDDQYVRAAIGVVTVVGEPSIATLIWREAFKGGRGARGAR